MRANIADHSIALDCFVPDGTCDSLDLEVRVILSNVGSLNSIEEDLVLLYLGSPWSLLC